MSEYRVQLVTKFENAPSTELNVSLLSHMHGFSLSKSIDKDSDILLFMGYDPDFEAAKNKNPNAIVGIIDPRPNLYNDLKKADFFLANGIEMVNYFAGSNTNSFIYPIYQALNKQIQCDFSDSIEKFVISYHGNKAHLELMETTVCKAIEMLSEFYTIELRCLYNIEQLGKWDWIPRSNKVSVKHLQWSKNAYETAFVGSHVGIVPNLIPFEPINSEFDNSLQAKNLSFDSDLKFRFKPTSNLGRILIFSQLGIPVIADMFPSSAEIIRHGVNGLLATGIDSWFIHLKKLADNSSDRRKYVNSMHQVFMNHYHWEVKNAELLQFFKDQIDFKKGIKSSFIDKFKQLFK